MGKFVITQRKDGEFQFNLKAGNGQVILTSEGYKTKGGCVTGINSVIANSPFDNRYEKKLASNGDYYFVLKAANGTVIGTSELYNSQSGLVSGIESVKENGQSDVVEGQTV